MDGAGKIHTDLAKRFVRAEVVRYEDFRRVGSMKEAKATRTAISHGLTPALLAAAGGRALVAAPLIATPSAAHRGTGWN